MRLINIVFLLTISVVSFAQKGKIPNGTQLSSWQTTNNYKGHKCEICQLEKKLPSGKMDKFFFDTGTQNNILPKGAKRLGSIGGMNSTTEAYSYLESNGAKKLLIIPKNDKKKIIRPFIIVDLPNEATGNFISLPEYYKDIILLETKIDSTNTFLIVDKTKGLLLSKHTNWENIKIKGKGHNEIMRMQKNGYYQFLNPDLSLSPINANQDLLGYMPLPFMCLNLKAEKKEGEIKYGLTYIGSKRKEASNRYEFYMFQVSEPIYSGFEIVPEKTFSSQTRPQDRRYTILLYNENEYTIWGVSDDVNYRLKHYDEQGNTIINKTKDSYQQWFNEKTLEDALLKAELKWIDIKSSNIEFAAKLDYENKLSALKRKEAENQKKLEAEYNQAVIDYKKCWRSQNKYCLENCAKILSEQTMANLRKEVMNGIHSKNEKNKPNAPYQNGSSYIEGQMYRNGYRRAKWNGRNWK